MADRKNKGTTKKKTKAVVSSITLINICSFQSESLPKKRSESPKMERVSRLWKIENNSLT
jgi:hypothetical protein